MEALYVVGAGGIGCAVGHALASAALQVCFVDTSPAKVAWGRAHGVAVDRRPPRAAAFRHFDDWEPEPSAVVLLCTKCYDNAAVLARLPPAVTLIPIQNGFDPALRQRPDRVEGIASFISECDPHRPHTRITRAGCLHLGFRGLPASADADVTSVDLPRSWDWIGFGGLRVLAHSGDRYAALLHGLAVVLHRHAGFRVCLVPDILPYKYTKLMYNAAISPLAAAAGLDNGRLLWEPRARRLFFDLLVENHAILRSAGVPLGKVGPFHPSTVARILRRRAVANALAWAFYPTLRGTYCSMSGDLPRGRTEIDYYNRHLIELAGDRPCPFNRRVYDVVKRLEQERRSDRGVLEELAA